MDHIKISNIANNAASIDDHEDRIASLESATYKIPKIEPYFEIAWKITDTDILSFRVGDVFEASGSGQMGGIYTNDESGYIGIYNGETLGSPVWPTIKEGQYFRITEIYYDGNNNIAKYEILDTIEDLLPSLI